MASAEGKPKVTTWYASINARIEREDLEAIAEELLDRLGDDAVVGVEADALEVDISVRARDVLAAARKAVDRATLALSKLKISSISIDALTLQTEAELDEELAQPSYPELVGVAEIADILGVSRQRVHELSQRRDFPVPIARLAAGPVWPRPWLNRFVDSWERKPGRPKRAG